MTRFQCHSDLYEMDLMMDINTSIYPLHVSPSQACIRLVTNTLMAIIKEVFLQALLHALVCDVILAAALVGA